MNISKMHVAIRPMSTSQAVDLGTMMARYWFVPLWKLWVCSALPFFLIFYVSSILLSNKGDTLLPILGAIIFWLCKPLIEKPMVSWLGQALFENIEDHSILERTVNGFKNIRQYSFTLLVKKRLSSHRQLLLPIIMLERPNKQQLKSRSSLLSRGQGNGLFWHTIILLHVETLIYIGIILTLSQLIPTSIMSAETYFTYLQYASVWTNLILALLYFFALSIIAPFFVAGGFAVYLTKRCLLEGWDVELTFKQLSQRYKNSQITSLKDSSFTNKEEVI